MGTVKNFCCFIKAKRLIFILLFLSSCILDSLNPAFIGEKDACNFTVNQYSGQGLRWDKGQFPVLFFIHESVLPVAEQNFISAVEAWNLAWTEYLEEEKGIRPFDLFAVEASYLKTGNPQKDKQNIIYFMGDSFLAYAPKKTIQAITAVHSTNESIKDTDILVNNKEYNYYYDEDYNQVVRLAKNQAQTLRGLASSTAPSLWLQTLQRLQNFFKFFFKPFIKKTKFRGISATSTIPDHQVDFPSLMIHELGHVPGMAHYEAASQNLHSERSKRRSSRHVSVMEPRLANGVNRREIKHYDLENLFCAYINW